MIFESHTAGLLFVRSLYCNALHRRLGRLCEGSHVCVISQVSVKVDIVYHSSETTQQDSLLGRSVIPVM